MNLDTNANCPYFLCMLTYLHDIRNKLTLIAGHTSILSKKYGEEDFLPIKTNLSRISELINDAYIHLKEENQDLQSSYSPDEFIEQLYSMAESVKKLFPVDIKNEVKDYRTRESYTVALNPKHIFQVIENAIDNSFRAKSTRVIVRLLDTGPNCILELVDNGVEKTTTMTSPVEVSLIPHGIGKEIMINNMKNAGGKVEWIRRLDNSGMVVRLYFPKKS